MQRFGENFSEALLFQSIVMLAVQLLLLYKAFPLCGDLRKGTKMPFSLMSFFMPIKIAISSGPCILYEDLLFCVFLICSC